MYRPRPVVSHAGERGALLAGDGLGRIDGMLLDLRFPGQERLE